VNGGRTTESCGADVGKLLGPSQADLYKSTNGEAVTSLTQPPAPAPWPTGLGPGRVPAPRRRPPAAMPLLLEFCGLRLTACVSRRCQGRTLFAPLAAVGWTRC
jgi:hypothetical protein